MSSDDDAAVQRYLHELRRGRRHGRRQCHLLGRSVLHNNLWIHAEYERADKQRTELYYQAKNSNALAANTLMESLGGAGVETCKALAKQRKVQVVEQAKSLRLTVKPHLTAAIQGHLPILPK